MHQRRRGLTPGPRVSPGQGHLIKSSQFCSLLVNVKNDSPAEARALSRAAEYYSSIYYAAIYRNNYSKSGKRKDLHVHVLQQGK